MIKLFNFLEFKTISDKRNRVNIAPNPTKSEMPSVENGIDFLL